MKLLIRGVAPEDRDAIWAIMEPTIRAGETYALPTDWDKESALNYWCDPTHTVFVAEEINESSAVDNLNENIETQTKRIVGTYFLHANQKGNGSHVANCGYMTSPLAFGKGIAQFMCQHSLEEARKRNFLAMQYNFVIQSNTRAVKLWQRMGFEIIGTIPKGFNHPVHGFTNVYIMHQFL